MEKATTLVSNETPEDVATLYSWANLRGAKYRDFSASRAQVREQARQRVQEAIASQRERAAGEIAAQQAAEPIIIEAHAQPQPVPYQPTSYQPGTDQVAAASADRSTFAAMAAAAQASAIPGVVPAAAPAPAVDQAAWRPAPFAAPAPTMPVTPVNTPVQSFVSPITDAPAPQQEDGNPMGQRWFALKNIFTQPSGFTAPVEPQQAPVAGRAPVLAVFSLAGGVGKSSLVATLGRTLSAHGERVLLVDTAAFGMLPFFFGASDHRPGVVRTFNAPTAAHGAPVEMLTLDPDGMGPESIPQEPLTQEIQRNARGSSRVIVDLATASGAAIRRILRMSPIVLVPVVADIGSVASVSAIESFFRRNASGTGQAITPYYVLNRFDDEQRLHQDVREILRGQLGERLLPFSLRRTPSMSEALAEGMTVVDYAPGSPAAYDYATLAAWVKSIASPADQGYRGARWSER